MLQSAYKREVLSSEFGGEFWKCTSNQFPVSLVRLCSSSHTKCRREAASLLAQLAADDPECAVSGPLLMVPHLLSL